MGIKTLAHMKEYELIRLALSLKSVGSEVTRTVVFEVDTFNPGSQVKRLVGEAGLLSWEFKVSPPMPTPPTNKPLIRPY